MISYSVTHISQYIPYIQLYEQYGILTDILMNPFLDIFEPRLTLGYFYSLIFLLNCSLIFYIAKKITSKSFAVGILLTYVLVSPRIQYPWPDYFSATAILVFIALSFSKETKLTNCFSLTAICLALFAREILIIYFCALILMLILATYFCKIDFKKYLKLIFIGIFIHYTILFVYLSIKNASFYYFIQTFNLVFWKDTAQPLAERFFTRFIGLSLGANSAVHIFQILVFGAIIFFFFHFNKLKNLNYKYNTVLILSFFCGLSGVLMSFHIPDLYRYQIYSFPIFFLPYSYFLSQKNTYSKIFKNSVILLPTFFFLFIGIKNNFKDASGESITLFNNTTKNYYGFYFNNEQINFYKNLQQALSRYQFVNKTPDPIIELIFPQSKYTAALPFYSEDFIKRLPPTHNKKFNFELTFIPNDKNCEYLGLMPEGVSFFTGSKYYLCGARDEQ